MHVDNDGRLPIHPGSLLRVLRGIDDAGHIGCPDRGAVAIGDDDGQVVGARDQLVVVVDGVGEPRSVQRALGLVDVGGGECGAQVFKAEVVGGKLRGIGLHADRRLLAAGNGDQADARDLGDLLGKVGVGGVFDLVQGQRIGGERQGHDGRVGRVHLAVDGWIGQVGGQEAVGGVDGGLDFLLGHIDVFVEVEFEGDDRAAAGADRGHLLEPGHLAELAFERSCDGRGHDVRPGAGIEREDLDDGVVHLGQARRPAAAGTQRLPRA